MNERHIRWSTPHLSRDFEMLVFGDGRGILLVLFPTSFGRFYQNKDFGLVGSIARYVDSGQFTVYCPDAHAQRLRECDRLRRLRFCAPRRLPRSRRGGRGQPGGLSRSQYRVSSSRRRQPCVQLERLLRYQLVLRRLLRRQHLFQQPYDYLPNIPDPWKYNHMGTGEWDNTRHETIRLSEILNAKGIQHFLDDRKWSGHDWNYWCDMLPHYLSLV